MADTGGGGRGWGPRAAMYRNGGLANMDVAHQHASSIKPQFTAAVRPAPQDGQSSTATGKRSQLALAHALCRAVPLSAP